MNRLHLMELADLGWWPRLLHEYMTDYLRHVNDLTDGMAAAGPVLRELASATGERHIVDLGSGGGGPWGRLLEHLPADEIEGVVLTDRVPSAAGLAGMAAREERLSAAADPVDAEAVPAHLTGTRTLFNMFHHFRPADARAVLTDACRNGRPVAVFEAMQRHVGFLLIAPLAIPAAVFLLTPGIRPFRISRLVLTYLLPVLPLAILFDGIVSALRVYSPDELERLVAGIDCDDDYRWEIKMLPSRMSAGITCLVGRPEPSEGVLVTKDGGW